MNKKLIPRGRNTKFKQKTDVMWMHKLQNLGLIHFLLQKNWLVTVFLGAVYYFLINLFFGVLYYIDMNGIVNARNDSFFDAFSFSIQSMNTIGYGYLSPVQGNIYINMVVTIQSFVMYTTYSITFSVLFYRFIKATRVKRTVRFSDIAVINTVEEVYNEDEGFYYTGDHSISFRFITTRNRDYLDPDFFLYLLSRVPSRFEEDECEYIMQELKYEIHMQRDRVRYVGESSPLFPLPMLVTHHINEISPFYGKTMEMLKEEQFELIGVYEAMEDISSQTFRRTWSYTNSDMVWGYRFASMIEYDECKGFSADYAKLNDIIETHNIDEEMGELGRDFV